MKQEAFTDLPLLDDFLLSLKANAYSAETIYNYERDLNVFYFFLDEINIPFSKISKKEILNYKAYLTSLDRKTPNDVVTGNKLSSFTINRMLSAIRSYLKFLIENDYKTPIPPDAIKMSKTVKKHPQVAEFEQLVKLIESPSLFEKNKLISLRNRAMLEILFATGLRISELTNLKIDQIDKDGKIFVLGKGKKERFAYLTPRSITHLNNYIKVRHDQSPFLFIPYRGQNAGDAKSKISNNYLQDKIKRYRERLGINVPTSAHSLRHGCATYLAESGANPAAIQVLLGHESLDTTTRYVHASDKFAQGIHKKFHPLQ